VQKQYLGSHINSVQISDEKFAIEKLQKTVFFFDDKERM
jgi:hypothetical protein